MKERLSRVRKNLQAKVNALKPYECDLNDKQHNELLRIVSSIGKDSLAIQQLCAEADEVLGVENNLLQEVWQQDVTERIQFERDQSTGIT